MVDTIIDIYYTRDYDGRHSFTEPAHPRKPDGHFTPTPAGTHYEAKHKNQHKRVKAAVQQARQRAVMRRRKKVVKKQPEDVS